MKKGLILNILIALAIVQPGISNSPAKPIAQLEIKNGLLKVASAAATPKTTAGLETYQVWVTAYSSTPEETDSTPFVTASNKTVRDGVMAANFLPFGSKVKIPEIFGDKVFTVEDRMHERKTGFVDIWMPTKEQAQKFGITRTEIVVLD